ncbi:hypothetical protein ACHAXS_005412 [Conticribra weissflogii]
MRNNKKHRQGGGPPNNNNKGGSSRLRRGHSTATANGPANGPDDHPDDRPDDHQDISPSSHEDHLDFCQTFFGDPLFTNFHVALLFFTAAFLPVIFWIPRFLSEQRRRQRILERERERDRRMEMAREAARALQETLQKQKQKQAKGQTRGGTDEDRKHQVVFLPPRDFAFANAKNGDDGVDGDASVNAAVNAAVNIALSAHGNDNGNGAAGEITREIAIKSSSDGEIDNERDGDSDGERDNKRDGERERDSERESESDSERERERERERDSDSEIKAEIHDDIIILPQLDPLTKSTLTQTDDHVLSHDDIFIHHDVVTTLRPQQPQTMNEKSGSASTPTQQHKQHNQQQYHDHNHPHLEFQPLQPTILPTLCPDGVTYGFDDWYTLRDAILEANAIAAEDFLRWNEYLLQSGKQQPTHPQYSSDASFFMTPTYPPPEPFVICPGVTLTRRSRFRIFSLFSMLSHLTSWMIYDNPLSHWIASPDSHHRVHHPLFHTATPIPENTHPLSSRSPTSTPSASTSPTPRRTLTLPKPASHAPLFFNAEDLTLECRDCTIHASHTHLSFGPHAKNVKIRGITFRGATTSSLTFHHHGADVSFEDCYWLLNSGGIVGGGVGGGGYGGNDGDDVVDNGDYRNRHASGGTNNNNHNYNNGNHVPNTPTHAGAVADLNSTSTVTFYRCVIDDQRQNPRRANVGAGVANVPGMNPPAGHLGGGTGPGGSPGAGAWGGGVGGSAVSSSLTIRN